METLTSCDAQHEYLVTDLTATTLRNYVHSKQHFITTTNEEDSLAKELTRFHNGLETSFHNVEASTFGWSLLCSEFDDLVVQILAHRLDIYKRDQKYSDQALSAVATLLFDVVAICMDVREQHRLKDDELTFWIPEAFSQTLIASAKSLWQQAAGAACVASLLKAAFAMTVLMNETIGEESSLLQGLAQMSTSPAASFDQQFCALRLLDHYVRSDPSIQQLARFQLTEQLGVISHVTAAVAFGTTPAATSVDDVPCNRPSMAIRLRSAPGAADLLLARLELLAALCWKHSASATDANVGEALASNLVGSNPSITLSREDAAVFDRFCEGQGFELCTNIIAKRIDKSCVVAATKLLAIAVYNADRAMVLAACEREPMAALLQALKTSIEEKNTEDTELRYAFALIRNLTYRCTGMQQLVNGSNLDLSRSIAMRLCDPKSSETSLRGGLVTLLCCLWDMTPDVVVAVLPLLPLVLKNVKALCQAGKEGTDVDLSSTVLHATLLVHRTAALLRGHPLRAHIRYPLRNNTGCVIPLPLNCSHLQSSSDWLFLLCNEQAKRIRRRTVSTDPTAHQPELSCNGLWWLATQSETKPLLKTLLYAFEHNHCGDLSEPEARSVLCPNFVSLYWFGRLWKGSTVVFNASEDSGLGMSRGSTSDWLDDEAQVNNVVSTEDNVDEAASISEELCSAGINPAYVVRCLPSLLESGQPLSEFLDDCFSSVAESLTCDHVGDTDDDIAPLATCSDEMSQMLHPLLVKDLQQLLQCPSTNDELHVCGIRQWLMDVAAAGCLRQSNAFAEVLESASGTWSSISLPEGPMSPAWARHFSMDEFGGKDLNSPCVRQIILTALNDQVPLKPNHRRYYHGCDVSKAGDEILQYGILTDKDANLKSHDFTFERRTFYVCSDFTVTTQHAGSMLCRRFAEIRHSSVRPCPPCVLVFDVPVAELPNNGWEVDGYRSAGPADSPTDEYRQLVSMCRQTDRVSIPARKKIEKEHAFTYADVQQRLENVSFVEGWESTGAMFWSKIKYRIVKHNDATLDDDAEEEMATEDSCEDNTPSTYAVNEVFDEAPKRKYLIDQLAVRQPACASVFNRSLVAVLFLPWDTQEEFGYNMF